LPEVHDEPRDVSSIIFFVAAADPNDVTCHFMQDEYDIVLTNPLPRPVIAEVLLADEIHRVSPALANLTMDETLPAYVEVCLGHSLFLKGSGMSCRTWDHRLWSSRPYTPVHIPVQCRLLRTLRLTSRSVG
jgi:hypothetical protein